MTVCAWLLLSALAGQVVSAKAPQANPYSGIEAWRVGVVGNGAHKKLTEQVSEMVKERGLRVVSWSSRQVGVILVTVTVSRVPEVGMSSGVVVVSIMRPVLTLQPWGADKLILASVWTLPLHFVANTERESLVVTQTWKRGLEQALASIASWEAAA